MIGFIGIGNMGGTLAKVANQAVACKNILVSGRNRDKSAQFAQEHGFTLATNETIAAQASVIFLGVKPHQMRDVLTELQPILQARTAEILLISMAAGVTTEQLEGYVGGKARVLRIMPNTPSLIGEGTIPYCKGASASDTDCAQLKQILGGAGALIPMEEHLIDAASAVAGCGPAFVYIFIEALADAGVACDLPRKDAIRLAAQMTAGSAKMVLQSDKHTGELKDAVCSPGGSTIAGVCALDENGFRSAVQKAVKAAFERNKTLGK